MQVIARDKKHLEQLIDETIKKDSPNCDLNFINVSGITDMSSIFEESALEKKEPFLNGIKDNS